MSEPQEESQSELEPVEQPTLPPITFSAGGESEEIRQANLESVLPSPGYPTCAFIFADAIAKKSDTVVFDFSAQSVVVRFKIDGLWHQMPSLDRQTGDYMVATLKKLSGLNYRERRARQESTFGANFGDSDYKCKIVSQGIKTGERVAITIRVADSKEMTLEDMGMRPGMKEKLISLMNQTSGMVVVTTLPGDGLSTAWQSVLNTSDRFTRDVVMIHDENFADDEVINVRSISYSKAKGETPVSNIQQILLREPDVLVFPEIPDGRTLDEYCNLATQKGKMVFTQLNAKHAIDGLFRLMLMKPTIEKLANAITCIVYQRMIRVLCEDCKQGFQPNPALLQRLGIPPGRVARMFTHFQLRPEDAVDENGQPIPVEPCAKCNGLGYYGRTGMFELLEVNDAIRQAMLKQPTVESVMQIAKANGHIALRDEGIVLAAKGTTSVEELQRVLKK